MEGPAAAGSEPSFEAPSAVLTAPARYLHSHIYEHLVSGEDDLTGLVAYGLYQSEKRAWITQFKSTRDYDPSEQEVQAFCFTYGEKRLLKLRGDSERLIFKVTERRLDERVEEISHRAFNMRSTAELQKLQSILKDISGYKHHVFAHILSFAILVGVYYFITFAVNHEPTISGLFGPKT